MAEGADREEGTVNEWGRLSCLPLPEGRQECLPHFQWWLGGSLALPITAHQFATIFTIRPDTTITLRTVLPSISF